MRSYFKPLFLMLTKDPTGDGYGSYVALLMRSTDL